MPVLQELTCTVIWKGLSGLYVSDSFLSCIKDWCINYNLDMVSGRYVTEKHMMNNTGMNSLSNRDTCTETIYT